VDANLGLLHNKMSCRWNVNIKIKNTVLIMEAVSASETAVNFYETTRRSVPEGCHLHDRRHEELTCHSLKSNLLLQVRWVMVKVKVITLKAHVGSIVNVSKYLPINSGMLSAVIRVRFQVLTAASMMFRVFWDVLPCS
jgi:hypothetical protein